jgi:hypothetical protein
MYRNLTPGIVVGCLLLTSHLGAQAVVKARSTSGGNSTRINWLR